MRLLMRSHIIKICLFSIICDFWLNLLSAKKSRRDNNLLFSYLFQRPRRDTKNCTYWRRLLSFSQAQRNMENSSLHIALLFIGGLASFLVLELRHANSNSSSSAWWRRFLGTVPGFSEGSFSVCGP